LRRRGAYIEEFDVRKGHRRATQKVIEGGGGFLTEGGCLIPMVMEGMRALVDSWEELTQAI
jgi:hypothetical protein